MQLRRRRRCAAALALLLWGARARAQGPDPSPTGRVMSLGEDGRIDIDIGDAGLKGGDVGVVERDGAQVGLASVLWVDLGHTRLRVMSTVPGQQVQVGDSVVFADRKVRPNAEAPVAPARKAGPGTVGTEKEEFVPLLAPVVAKKSAQTRTASVFHGRLRASEIYQSLEPSKAWYSASRLDSDGSVERAAGGAWSINWAGNVSRRNGSVQSTADDYRKLQPHLYRGTLTRKAGNGGFVRLGRFYPGELSGIGYVDGAQLDAPLVAGLRLGAAGGMRPDRVNMGFSSRESVAAAYATGEAGEARKLYYSGSLGLVRTYYEGRNDEFAALWDQRADLGPKLNLYGSAQFDFNTGAAVLHTGTRLTRLNLSLNSPVTERLSLRAGANHFEPLDTYADRALAGGTTLYLNNGYWRYWLGTGQTWGDLWTTDEDLSFTNTVGQWTPGQWRLSVGRRALFGRPSAFVNAAVYNLYNPAGPDYGATLSAGLSLFEERLALDAATGSRFGPTSVSRRRYWASDASFHATWRPGSTWTFDAGLTRTWQEAIHSTIANAGVSWRW